MYIDVEALFAELESGRKNNTLRNSITSSKIKYQISADKKHIEQIDEHGNVSIGQFINGKFQPLKPQH